MQSITQVTLVVQDYDEAIAFFTQALGFVLLEDAPETAEKRWVVVAPAESSGAALLLAKASTPEQSAVIGRQAGGRVGFFLRTSEFWRDYQRMQEHGVRFAEQPRREAYGTVVVFYDLYGNKWDLIGPLDYAV